MTDEKAPESPPAERVIDLRAEVTGTPEQVWTAIATGAGISSWFVPTTVQEREGGETTSRFGEGPDMLVPGRVAAWDPPRRVVFDNGDGVPGLAFEWLVEARDGGTCVVRLVTTGFVAGTPWDDQYDGLTEGWKLFLLNLQSHLAHFAGRVGTAMLPTATWPATPAESWARLTAALGIPASPSVGQRLVVAAPDAPPLAGRVTSGEPGRRLALLVDEPAPGTAIVACEGEAAGEQTGVSVWSYLYGDGAAALVARDEPRWQGWLDTHSPEPKPEDSKPG